MLRFLTAWEWRRCGEVADYSDNDGLELRTPAESTSAGTRNGRNRPWATVAVIGTCCSLERPCCGCWPSARPTPRHSRRPPRPRARRRPPPTKSSAHRGKEATSRTLPRKSGSDGQSDEKSKDEATPPAYKLLRYEEDYSYLKDPSRRTDFWDPIKYIPLWGRDDWYLSIGGELRERYEFYHNQDAGAVPANAQGNNGYLLERYLLHGDLHLGPYFRFFGQFVTGLEDGRIGGPRPTSTENAFDVHQAFADFVLPLGEREGHAHRPARAARVRVRLGAAHRRARRREPAPVVRRRPAAAAYGGLGGGRLVGKPVLNRPGVFDDDPDPTRSFWGCTPSTRCRCSPRATSICTTSASRTRTPSTFKGRATSCGTRSARGSGGGRCRGSTTSNTTGSSARSGRATSRRGAPRTPSATTSAICRSSRASAFGSTSPAATTTRPRRTSRPSTRCSPRACTSTSSTRWGRST